MKKLVKFNLEKINGLMKHTLKHQIVNNFQLISVSGNKKLSIVIKPNIENRDSYYGLHPSFDSARLRDFYFSLSNHSMTSFWEGVIELQRNESIFNLFNVDGKEFHYEHQSIEIALLGRAIIQMASHFGYRFEIESHEQKAICQILKELKLENVRNEANEVVILGILNEEDIRLLDYYFSIEIMEDRLKLYLKNNNQTFQSVMAMYPGEFFNPFFKMHFKFQQSGVYYSGVMPRVTRIEWDNNEVGSEIKCLKLYVDRTTFATVDLMDNPQSIEHSYIVNSEFYTLLTEFDFLEDCIQSKYLTDVFDNEFTNVERINQYLRYSYNTHTVAVSANITTADNVLILGKRSKSSIDHDEYYCAVNGQSEFKDRYVKFYSQSVYEDLPTLEYNDNMRLDFNNEMQREVVAELGVAQFKNNWGYYGLSFLNIHPFDDKELNLRTSKEVIKRRMHFNVLMHNEVFENFAQVVKKHQNATENFENQAIEGIKFNFYQNLFEKIANQFKEWIMLAYGHIGIITFFMYVSFKLIESYRGNMSINDMDWASGIEFGVIILYLVILFDQYIKMRPFRKLVKKVNIDIAQVRKAKDILRKVIYSNRKFKKERFHGIAQVMLLLYVYNQVEE